MIGLKSIKCKYDCEPEGWSYLWVWARLNAELLNCTNLRVYMCLLITWLGVLSRIKCNLACPTSKVYRHMRSSSLARSLLWRTLVIGLQIDHRRIWSHKKTIDAHKQRMIALNEYISIVIDTITASYSFFSVCCCIAFFNLIQFFELNYLYQRAISRACSPILILKRIIFYL